MRGVPEFGGGWGLPRGQKRVQLMGLGLKATVPLGFWSFWRILVRLQSRLKVSAESRNLEGLGVARGSKKGTIDGFGPQGNCTTWFLVI